MGRYESLIGIAGTLGLISFSSLLQKIYTTHNTSSLPWTWLFSNLAAQVLSLIYGIGNGAYGIYIPNSFFILGLSYIYYVKITYKEKDSEAPPIEPAPPAKKPPAGISQQSEIPPMPKTSPN